MAVAAYPPPMRVNLKELLENDGNSSTTKLDLGWEPFRTKIDRFLGEVDRYVSDARNEIGDRLFQHKESVRQVNTKKAEVEKDIANERTREGEMLATLDDERRTVQEITASLNHLRNNLTKVREQSASLESELNAIRKEVTTERAEKDRQGKTLAHMKQRDGDDLEMLQEAIGWKVQGIEADKLLMRFTLIDPSEPDREFSIVIDISKHDYSIPKCSPYIPNLADLLRDLNADRDFATFIKRVRRSFKALCPTNEPGSRLDMLSGVTRTPARSKLLAQPQAPAQVEPVENGLEGLTLKDQA